VLSAISQPPALGSLRTTYDALEKAARAGDETLLRGLVNLLLPDYRAGGAQPPATAPAAAAPAARAGAVEWPAATSQQPIFG
jgi:hypothetical protein